MHAQRLMILISTILVTFALTACGGLGGTDTDYDDDGIPNWDDCFPRRVGSAEEHYCPSGDRPRQEPDDDNNGTTNNGEEPCVDETVFRDEDGDGFGNGAETMSVCTDDELPDGYTIVAGDCNDMEAEIRPPRPNEVEQHPAYEDKDGDGVGAGSAKFECEESDPERWVKRRRDCNDEDPTMYPGADEICDFKDNDCDGDTDEGVQVPVFIDYDGDGYGSEAVDACLLDDFPELVEEGGDCNDDDPAIHPGAEEVCDEIDNDCDGEVNEGLTQTYYPDNDDDGLGDPNRSREECEDPSTDDLMYVLNSGDCNDQINTIRGPRTWFKDEDGDGSGDMGSPQVSCTRPARYVSNSNDCDDQDANRYPGNDEVCDGADNDCDNQVDEEATDRNVFYADADGDEYGDAEDSILACSQPAGYVSNSNDCDDTDHRIHPNTWWCQDMDNDGFVSDGVCVRICTEPTSSSMFRVWNQVTFDCNDTDADTYPGADEICDEMDNDCDGEVDEDGAIGAQPRYRDIDDDGWGQDESFVVACSLPAGYSNRNGDCDDAEASINPGADEVCDEADNDCDGAVDEGVLEMLFIDNDDDGWGGEEVQACPHPTLVSVGGDCHDDNPDLNLSDFDGDGFTTCDPETPDCDDTDADLNWSDEDGDGYATCETVPDCDDGSAARYPGADEACMPGLDLDCNGIDSRNQMDVQCRIVLWYEELQETGEIRIQLDDRITNASLVEVPVGFPRYLEVGSDALFEDGPETCWSLDADCGQTAFNVNDPPPHILTFDHTDFAPRIETNVFIDGKPETVYIDLRYVQLIPIRQNFRCTVALADVPGGLIVDCPDPR